MNGDIKRSRKPLHLQARQSPASAAQTEKLGRHFARISRAPLKKQDTSDAWNERQNRLAAGRDAAKMLLMASYKRGAEKAKK